MDAWGCSLRYMGLRVAAAEAMPSHAARNSLTRLESWWAEEESERAWLGVGVGLGLGLGVGLGARVRGGVRGSGSGWG